MTHEELKQLQSLPLDVKIAKTEARIQEYVYRFGLDGVYVAFSGGKDSTVLLDIARKMYPDMKAMYCDTGLENPDVRNFALKMDNLDVVRPAKNFKEVLTEYGYPVVSKEQSKYIEEARRSEEMRKKRIEGFNGKKDFIIAKKWYYLLDAPFKISPKCCDIMKKNPAKKYEKETGRHAILGTLAEESHLRTTEYLKYGCNRYETNSPKCRPLSFWREEDILKYIVSRDIAISPFYGLIIKDKNGWHIDGNERSGCMFCAFGCHMEPEPNRFVRMKREYPKLWKYCIGGGKIENGYIVPDENGLGLGEVLEYMSIPYGVREDEWWLKN